MSYVFIVKDGPKLQKCLIYPDMIIWGRLFEKPISLTPG
jgi:hypothetical protein